MRGKRLVIRDDVPAAELRRLARREPDRAAAARMQAVAGALEGLSRAEAARLAGMERQALRDAVLRYNAEGLVGLHDRPRPGSKPRLDDTQRAALLKLVLDGPDVEKTGLSAWTLVYLRERHLSHRLLNGYDAIVDALCAAWNQLTPKRLHALTGYPYLNQVSF